MTEPRCPACGAELAWDGPTVSHEGFSAVRADGEILVGGVVRVTLSTECCGRPVPEGTFRCDGPLERVCAVVQPLPLPTLSAIIDWRSVDTSKPLPMPPVMPRLGERELADLLNLHRDAEGHMLSCEWCHDDVRVEAGEVTAVNVHLVVICSCGIRLFQGTSVGQRTSERAPQAAGPGDSFMICDLDDSPAPFPLAVTCEDQPRPLARRSSRRAQRPKASTTPTPRAHPAATLFPLMTEAEVQRLAEDIGANGLLEPIVMYNGDVLEGRNRLRACAIAGVEPVIIEWSGGGSPLDFVVSANALRRQLNTRQRTVAAARAVHFFEVEARERMLRGKANPLANSPKGREQAGGSRDRAAALFGVASRMVGDAMKALATGAPELVAALEAGRISISRAAQLATLPPNEQRNGLTDRPVRRRAAVPRPPEEHTQPSLPSAWPQPDLGAVGSVFGLAMGFVRSTPRPSSSPAVDAFAKMLEELFSLAEQNGWISARARSGVANTVSSDQGGDATGGNHHRAPPPEFWFDPSKLGAPRFVPPRWSGKFYPTPPVAADLPTMATPDDGQHRATVLHRQGLPPGGAESSDRSLPSLVPHRSGEPIRGRGP